MTRTTVHRALTDSDPTANTVADVFQAQREAEHGGGYGEALRLGLDGTNAPLTIAGGEPIDVYIRGYPTEDPEDLRNAYVVHQNGEVVETGQLARRVAEAVVVRVGPGRAVIPPGQRIEIEVVGHPTEEGA